MGVGFDDHLSTVFTIGTVGIGLGISGIVFGKIKADGPDKSGSLWPF